VHQGALIEAEPLKAKALGALVDTQLVLVLDQVTDPHNVGAIIRSAVAFGAGALITTERHSPHESGVLAKSASGALEHIDLIEVKNLAAALGELHEAGFQSIGLDSDGPAELEHSFAGKRIALVLGAEGKGLRQKSRETVTTLARLDMPGRIRSLNVSNAAAVALYAAGKYIEANRE
jgi:23S rRNA (guanosine2251-2'-O)-methyltransferase